MAYCAMCGSEIPEGIGFCGKCGAPIDPRLAEGNRVYTNNAYSNVFQAGPAPYPPKKKTKKTIAIGVGAAVVIVVAVIAIAFSGGFGGSIAHMQDNTTLRFSSVKNYDRQLASGKVKLTLANIKYTQNFIKREYPDFDLEKEGYSTDDYRNRLIADDFNQNPSYMQIYLTGYSEDAGLSAVYAKLVTDESGALLGYYFLRDQEFSDGTGFEYSTNFDYTYFEDSEDFRLTSISLGKFLYRDADIWHWSIIWGDSPDDNKQERRAALMEYLSALRYSKVYTQLDMGFFLNVYTGIELNEQIGDLIDWSLDAGAPGLSPQPGLSPAMAESPGRNITASCFAVGTPDGGKAVSDIEVNPSIIQRARAW